MYFYGVLLFSTIMDKPEKVANRIVLLLLPKKLLNTMSRTRNTSDNEGFANRKGSFSVTLYLVKKSVKKACVIMTILNFHIACQADTRLISVLMSCGRKLSLAFR